MKTKVTCPLCLRTFDPRLPVMHISKYHKDATDAQLAKIRNVRRNAIHTSNHGYASRL